MARRPAAVLLALVGLVVSVMLLVDYSAAAPTFCAEGGCATVRASGWARPLGIPMPVFGIVYFAMAALVRRRELALAGTVGAAALLVIQGAMIGTFCKLCVVADLAALAQAAVVLVPRRRVQLAGVLAAPALLAALWFARSTPPQMTTPSNIPDVVAAAQVPGTVTIVDFVDFECPFCRAQHAKLSAAIARADVPVHVVRKMVPLSMHRGAMPAALAWCCADAQGRGDAMADALIAADPAELTPEGCERIAASVGCDLARYRADLAAPSTRARVDTDAAAARAAGIRSLPTLYIGDTAFVGAGATVEQLTAALTHTAPRS